MSNEKENNIEKSSFLSPLLANTAEYEAWVHEERTKDRKEMIKFLITISSAILTFTITFRKDIVGDVIVSNIILLQITWILLLISTILGIIYYILEYRYSSLKRFSRVRSEIPTAIEMKIIEKKIYNYVAYITPYSFILSLLFLTAFVIFNV